MFLHKKKMKIAKHTTAICAAMLAAAMSQHQTNSRTDYCVFAVPTDRPSPAPSPSIESSEGRNLLPSHHVPPLPLQRQNLLVLRQKSHVRQLFHCRNHPIPCQHPGLQIHCLHRLRPVQRSSVPSRWPSSPPSNKPSTEDMSGPTPC